MSRADWLTEEGGGLITSIKGFTVREAYFAVDPGYAEGVYLLHWFGVDADGNEYTADGFHPAWPAPNGFVSMDSGATVRHAEGYKLRKNGWLGRLADRTMEITEGVTPDPLDGFSPLEASGWVGLTFDLENFEVDYGREIGKKSRLLPTTYRGQNGEATVVVDTADTRSAVINLAVASGSFDEFKAAALTIPGVVSDSALVSEIIDQTNGIWSQVKG